MCVCVCVCVDVCIHLGYCCVDFFAFIFMQVPPKEEWPKATTSLILSHNALTNLDYFFKAFNPRIANLSELHWLDLGANQVRDS